MRVGAVLFGLGGLCGLGCSDTTDYSNDACRPPCEVLSKPAAGDLRADSTGLYAAYGAEFAGVIARVYPAGASDFQVNFGIGSWLGLQNGRIFWEESGLSGESLYDVLHTASVDDPTPQSLVTLPSLLRNAVADDTSVYFSVDSRATPLARVDLAGGAASELTPAWGNTWIGIDATNLYFTDQGSEQPASADDPNVGRCELRSMPIGGGPVTTLFVSDRDDTIYGCEPIKFRVYAGYVFWLQADADLKTSLMQVPVSGGPATTIATNIGGYGWFAVDDRFVYYLADTPSPGELLKVPLDGGAATLVRTLAPSPTSIAVDDHHVYWSGGKKDDANGTVLDTGSIFMAPK